jgi:hypothetical protein
MRILRGQVDAGDRSTQPDGHSALLNIRQQDPADRSENA